MNSPITAPFFPCLPSTGSMGDGEEIDQDFLNMLIPSGIGILHPDQLQVMFVADGFLLPVAVLHHFALAMLFAVQFNG